MYRVRRIRSLLLAAVEILMRHRAPNPVLGVAKSKSMHVGAPLILAFARSSSVNAAVYIRIQRADARRENVA